MVTQDFITQILSEVQRKHALNITEIQKGPHNDFYKPYVKSDSYFEGIINEVYEALEENKNNNKVYFEDELSDIMWNYMSLLYFLEFEGKISIENVMKKCYKKYHERVQGLADGILWQDIKKQQKQELTREHIEKYGD